MTFLVFVFAWLFISVCRSLLASLPERKRRGEQKKHGPPKKPISDLERTKFTLVFVAVCVVCLCFAGLP